MTYTIDYLPQARTDISHLSSALNKRVGKIVEKKLTTHPDIYGKPLHSPQQGFWSLRAGDYRIIYKITGKIVTVYTIGHRGTVYNFR